MLIDRILPVEEWDKLQGVCELGETLSHLDHDPDRTRILVVEDDGAIVGVWALLTVHRAEGLWIHPHLRGKTSVARHLWTVMQRTIRTVKAWRVETGACDPLIARLIERHGGRRIPVDAYVLPVKGL